MKYLRFVFPVYILLVLLVTPMLTLATHSAIGTHGYVPPGGAAIFTGLLAGFIAKMLVRYFNR